MTGKKTEKHNNKKKKKKLGQWQMEHAIALRVVSVTPKQERAAADKVAWASSACTGSAVLSHQRSSSSTFPSVVACESAGEDVEHKPGRKGNCILSS